MRKIICFGINNELIKKLNRKIRTYQEIFKFNDELLESQGTSKKIVPWPSAGTNKSQIKNMRWDEVAMLLYVWEYSYWF